MEQERVFSEQEVEQILRRAVELTEQATASTYRPGVTRDELEKIAGEVGVSPDALLRALSEYEGRKREVGPLSLTQEFTRVVEGEMDPANFDIIAEGLKPLANAGQPAMAQVGRKFTMSTWTGVGQAKIDVTSRQGRTKLTVKSTALFQALMTLHPALMASIVAVGALSERGQGWLGAAIAGVAMLVGGLVFGWLTRKGHRDAEALADSLRDRLAQSIAAQGRAEVRSEAPAELEQRLGQE